jgi:hypothetical protein
MTTSGIVTYDLTRNQVIIEALSLIRVGTDAEPLTEAMVQDAARSLNMMVKSWEADGLHLWSKTQGVLFTVPGQEKYTMGPGATDHASESYVEALLSADAAAGSTSVTVVDDAGILDNDYIGIELEDLTMHWTRVNGTPVANVVNLDDALPSSAASGQVVFAYTTKITRPMRILQAQRRGPGVIDIPIDLIERPDYFDQPNKQTRSQVVMAYYSPRLSVGEFYVWPTSNTVRQRIIFTFEKQLQIFDAMNDTPDLPPEWLETLAYNLAYRLAPKYGFPLQERALLKIDADEKKQTLLGFDREYASTYFVPDAGRGNDFPTI